MGLRVVTAGTFDLIHQEHLSLFSWCRKLAGTDGTVTVVVNSDDFVEQFKGHVPVVPTAHRLAVVNCLKPITGAVENVWREDLRGMVQELQPDVIVVGSDWAERDYFAQTMLDWPFLYQHDCMLAYAPSAGDVHSSDFRESG